MIFSTFACQKFFVILNLYAENKLKLFISSREVVTPTLTPNEKKNSMHRRALTLLISKLSSAFPPPNHRFILCHSCPSSSSTLIPGSSAMVRHASAHPLANSPNAASTSDADGASSAPSSSEEVMKAYEEAVRTLNSLQSNKMSRKITEILMIRQVVIL